MAEPHGKNLVYLHFLKNLVIDFDLGGEAHVDRIWNLINFPMDLEGSLRTVIGNLPNLLSHFAQFKIARRIWRKQTKSCVQVFGAAA